MSVNQATHRVVVAFISATIALTGLTSTTLADIINVPGDYPTIQQGIDAAVDGDEVVLADGTYTGAENRNVDFLGKAITVRSANGPENCIVDLEETANRGFLFVNGETNATVLDGVTVCNAEFETDNDLLRGGAIFIDDASPTISNCIFWNNHLVSIEFRAHGGAIYSSGNPTLTNCVFDTNSIWAANFDDVFDGSVSADGGAFYNDGGNPQFFDCHFLNNRSTSHLLLFFGVGHGGAIGGFGSVALTRCTFVDNRASSNATGLGGAVKADGATMIDCHFEANEINSCNPARGGAIAITGESSLVINCSFVDNIACGDYPPEGGAMSGSGTLINCLFVGNAAYGNVPEPARGGGFSGNGSIYNCTFVGNDVFHDGPGAAIAGDVFVFNTVVWNNLDGDPISGAKVTYSNIQGGWPGEGNIDADPFFVDPDNGDYRLAAGSPCIDAGNNTVLATCIFADIAGNVRFVDDPRTRDTGLGRAPIVDMGAYEFGSRPAIGGEDCNQSWLDDACETASGYTADCNRNGVPDECDIADGSSSDCNGNGIPDDCEEFEDCNGNGALDECDIADGFSSDCNVNGVPDECEPFADCNRNGVFDACDIADGTSEDCNTNDRPDECDIAVGFSDDCNGNGIPDDCDIAEGASEDCNGNGIPDDCEGWSVGFSYPKGLPKNVAVNREFAIEVVIETTGEVEIDPESATIHVSIDGGAFASTPMEEIGELTFLATLPASRCAAELEYYFSVDAVGGCIINDPPSAPEDIYAAFAGTAVTTFLDEFEGDVSGWTIINDKSLVTGAWEQAEPNGTIYLGEPSAPYEDATAGDGNVMAFVTENGPRGGDAADTDVDGGPTQLISPRFDLADTAATISYARWFYTASGVHDEMTIEVSADDGETWVLVDTVTSTDSQWQTASFVVNDFIEPTPVVRVRFTADDSPNDSVTEAGIDDFMVFYTSCIDDCTWDLDGDDIVGAGDLIVLLGSWGDPYGTADLIELLGNWGPCR